MSKVLIGELSSLTGLSKDSLRYYEDLGLILPSERTESNYRLYEMPNTLQKILFIKKAQTLGFSLAEIKDILQAGSPPCCEQVKFLLKEKIAQIENKIAQLNEHLAFLKETEKGWKSIPFNEKAELCPLIESL